MIAPSRWFVPSASKKKTPPKRGQSRCLVNWSRAEVARELPLHFLLAQFEPDDPGLLRHRYGWPASCLENVCGRAAVLALEQPTDHRGLAIEARDGGGPRGLL